MFDELQLLAARADFAPCLVVGVNDRECPALRALVMPENGCPDSLAKDIQTVFAIGLSLRKTQRQHDAVTATCLHIVLAFRGSLVPLDGTPTLLVLHAPYFHGITSIDNHIPLPCFRLDDIHIPGIEYRCRLPDMGSCFDQS
jgi:hypothetical protein